MKIVTGYISHDTNGTKQAGFTLIELSVVLVIVGIIISIMATVLPSLIQAGKIKKARAILEKADISLLGYVSATGRCPCPDTDGDGKEDRNDAGTQGDPSDDTCTRYAGDIPYLTLNISSGDDVWNHRLKYAVYEDLIKTTSSSGSNPFCTAVDTVIQYYDPQDGNNPADTGKLYLTDLSGQNPENMAYVIVSAGAKDLDGDRSDGLFDGFNEGQDLHFDHPGRIEFHGDPAAKRYDDLLRAISLTYLKGYVGCVGMGGGSGGSSPGSGTTAGENTYPDGCINGTDDDSDGYIDCDDQDCFGIGSCGTGGDDVVITTSALPSGAVNSSFAATIQASGGMTPYEWTLPDNGGFDLFLHTYTGQLSGTLDQCPGNSTIQVQVQDTTPVSDGGPKTASRAFSIQVTSDMAVSRTSGAGVDITWDSPTQQEEFKATGGHLGNITWQLVSGGAPGFSVTTTGDDSCSIAHNGTVAGTYSFTLTAIDANCPTNTAEIIFNVMVTSSGAVIPIPQSVESFWKMDECQWDGTADEVQDSQGTVPGTAKSGARTAGFGKICRGGFFDGSNDYVDMGDAFNSVFGPTSNKFSVAAWLNPLSLSAAQTNHRTRNTFVAKASDSFNDNLEIGVNTNGTIHVYLDTQARDTYADFGSAGDIALGRWSFVVVAYDNGNVTVTINGTKYPNTTAWSGSGNIDTAAGSLFTIGSSQHTNNYFHGRIDEVMVFSEALTDSEISDLHDLTRSNCTDTCYTNSVAEYYLDESFWSGTGTVADVSDASGNGYNGTSFYGADTTADGKLCRGGAFTNSGAAVDNDRVKLPYEVVNGLQDFTFAAWVKTSRTGQQAVVSGANASQNNEFLIFLPNGSTISTYLKGPAKSYSALVSDDSWHHIAWVRDGNVESVSFDGQTIGANTVTGNAVVTAANGLWLGAEQDSVGGAFDPNQEFVGTLDEVYFFDRALSESEIQGIIDTTRSCN